MKAGFYPKLVLDGIRKNKRLYLPYILTCIGMVAMYYIIVFLRSEPALSQLRGEEFLRSILDFGGWVVAIFSCVFLFYTNAFLLRRRKKEFGLYNILGMGKWGLCRLLFWENAIIAAFSVAAGLVFGIALSKLAELGLVKIMRGEAEYTLQVSGSAVVMTAAVFGVIFLLLFLNALRQVRFSGALALIRSESMGEKPPKANWVCGILGAGMLIGAYYISLSIQNPISAVTMFFAAVLLVVAATYLLLISGSVLLCRVLQKNKNYYYKPNHFVSISSMAFRMKRNGAGLASICILATMVLVMISSTTCLYFGGEDVIVGRYPKQFNVDYYMGRADDLSDEKIEALRADVLRTVARYGAAPENEYSCRSAVVAGLHGKRPFVFVCAAVRLQCDDRGRRDAGGGGGAAVRKPRRIFRRQADVRSGPVFQDQKEAGELPYRTGDGDGKRDGARGAGPCAGGFGA